jgi:hypothetical protein
MKVKSHIIVIRKELHTDVKFCATIRTVGVARVASGLNMSCEALLTTYVT